MSDSERSEAKQSEQNLQNEIDKEIQKLVYYAESFDETRNEGDLDEMKITRDRGTAIVDKIFYKHFSSELSRTKDRTR